MCLKFKSRQLLGALLWDRRPRQADRLGMPRVDFFVFSRWCFRRCKRIMCYNSPFDAFGQTKASPGALNVRIYLADSPCSPHRQFLFIETYPRPTVTAHKKIVLVCPANTPPSKTMTPINRWHTCFIPRCGRPTDRGGPTCHLCSRYICRIHFTSPFHDCRVCVKLRN